MKTSGWTMQFVWELSTEFKNVITEDLDNMIAIGELNVFNYTVEAVDHKQQQNC